MCIRDSSNNHNPYPSQRGYFKIFKQQLNWPRQHKHSPFKTPWTLSHPIPHEDLQPSPKSQHYPRRMETGKDHSHSQTKQRSDRWKLLQTNFTAISNSKNLGKSNSPLHNLKHTTNQSPTWLQNFPLNQYGTSSINKSNNTRFQSAITP